MWVSLVYALFLTTYQSRVAQKFAPIVQQEDARNDLKENYLKSIPSVVLYCWNTLTTNTTLKQVTSGYSDDNLQVNIIEVYSTVMTFCLSV